MKNGRYSVFQSPNGDGKIQYLIDNTTMAVFIQKFDYDITVIFEKINGNNGNSKPRTPPPKMAHDFAKKRDQFILYLSG